MENQMTWNAVREGDTKSFFQIYEHCARKGILIDPLWQPNGATAVNILLSAVENNMGSVVEKLLPLIVVPKTAFILDEGTTVGRISKVLFMTKATNPFLHAVKTLTKFGDEETCEMIKILKPVLYYVPEPHRRAIMNEGVITQAIMHRFYETVKYLLTPESGADPFFVDTASADGTYSLVDLAYRYEKNKVISVSRSMTKIIWERTGGYRGSIYRPRNKPSVSNQFFTRLGIDTSKEKLAYTISEEDLKYKEDDNFKHEQQRYLENANIVKERIITNVSELDELEEKASKRPKKMKAKAKKEQTKIVESKKSSAEPILLSSEESLDELYEDFDHDLNLNNKETNEDVQSAEEQVVSNEVNEVPEEYIEYISIKDFKCCMSYIPPIEHDEMVSDYIIQRPKYGILKIEDDI